MFESNDDLPLGKILNIPVCVIIAKSVFFFKKYKYYNNDKYDKYCLQVHLKDCFYEYGHENENNSYVVC